MSRAMKRARLSLLILLAATSAVAQQTSSHHVVIPAKLPLTHETMWLMKRVGAPVPSPDGKWVVFSVSTPAYDEKDQSSDLWIAPTDGSGGAHQITSTKASESDVTWSPDSKMIAFSTKREGDDTAQIYTLDVTGPGEAQRLTSISTGARLPQFSPHGEAILFVTTAYPDAADDDAQRKIAKERKEQKYKVRAYDYYPVRRWDRWLDDTHAHLEVQMLNPSAKPHDVLAGTQLVASPGFAGSSGEGSREDIDAVWAPDGESIVFIVTTKRNTSAYAEVPDDIYVADPHHPEPRLIAHDEGGYGQAKFSPDGKTLYVKFEPTNGKVYNLARLVAFDWPSMQNRRVLTASSDRSVNSYAITPDGKTIYFTAEDSGLEKIYSLPASGGTVTLAFDPERGVCTDLAIPEKASSTMLFARWGSSINPAEVVRIDPAAKKWTNITSFDVEAAARVDWLAPIHFWFTSSRGKKIHNMLVLPPAFEETKKYPLLVLMHGGAANMWRDQISLRWNYHLLAKPGYVILLTNYTGSTGFGEKFGQDIQGDPLKGPADEINEAADYAIKHYAYIDGTKQAAAGASYGGHLAHWMEATTTRYKCIIGHAGEANLESQWGTSDENYHRELTNLGPFWETKNKIWVEQSPVYHAPSFKTPELLSVGEHDYRVPMNETLEMWATLQRMRVPSRLLVWPDENHWIQNAENSRYFYKEVADWMARWMK
jgi:dipeptidyl aminopeptidase/acylaminoacyl peptidase